MTTLITAAKETRRTNNLHILGSLSNDDGDGNENDKKATGLGSVYMEWGTPV